jgi:hypothetical protein
MAPPFVLAWIVGTSVIYWSCIRLKKVSLVGDSFVISNFRREIRVAARDVERVTGSVLWSPELVWLHVRTPTDFGRKIVFMPGVRLFGGFSQHPLVSELSTFVAHRP